MRYIIIEVDLLKFTAWLIVNAAFCGLMIRLFASTPKTDKIASVQ